MADVYKKPTSPSPSIQKAADNSWNGGVPKGQTAQQALADKNTGKSKQISPTSIK